MKYTALVDAAKKAKRHAHAPYSNFRVGAAVLTKSGEIITGCNIENSSYSLTMCAERTAIFKAMSESKTAFTALAIVSDDPELITPCGACRQVILDLAGNIDIILTTKNGNIKILKMNKLLPYPFTGRSLEQFKKEK